MKKRWIAWMLCGMMAFSGCGSSLAGSVGGNVEPDRAEKDITETDITETDLGDHKEDAAGRESRREEIMTGKPEKLSLETVVTKGKYEKAAYLADMVYQKNGAENTLISPLSLDMALGLISGGAVGKTREELLAYLGSEDYDAYAEEYMKYVEQLNRDSEGMTFGGYKTVFEIANSIWVRDDRELLKNYAKQARKQYQAEIEPVSFSARKAGETVGRINDWCKEKTHGLIPAILTEDAISEDMMTILVNSLYFEAPWADSWGKGEYTFTDIDGKESKQEMLTDTLSIYFENEYATAFSKHYMNGLQFIGILPKQEGDFQLRDLEIESLLQNRVTNVDVVSLMPKLNFESTADNIVSVLESQGMTTPFDKTAADFSNLVQLYPDEVTYISDIIQKCKIELDEDGTRAAAVTAIIAKNMAAMPMEKEIKEVLLNRPFAFLIYDEENDQIVFMGKVVRL